MDFSQDVADILCFLVKGIRRELSDNLTGIYLRGSLAYGGFNPATSDIDVLVVTERAVGEAEFRQLFELHKQIARLSNPYARRIEVAYIDRQNVKEYRPGQHYPTLEQGEDESLKWSEHRENWILERWSIREHGKTLWGPEPQELIAPISPEEISGAVSRRLLDWVEWAQNEADADWRLPKSHKAYVIETMCRVLYALAKGEMVNKAQAVVWAKTRLPKRWRELVERSQYWRTDGSVDESVNEEIREFIIWVASSNQNAT